MTLPVSSSNKLSESAPQAPVSPLGGINKTVKIKPDEIQLFAKYIYSLTGIHIEASKAYLIETRLGRLLEAERCESYSEFYHKAKTDGLKALEKKIIDAITTNETLFFRDTNPFELLKHKILPEVIDRQASKSMGIPIRIWSTACSTGQEVYSIAIVIKELLGNTKVNVKLTGTDLSDAVIQQASYGSYNKFEIERGLPQASLQRYFKAEGANWKIKDELRAMATFRKFNLMDPFSAMGKFDIIFCRNVAIYFTLEDRMKLFNKIADVLEPDGFLIIGSTESLTGVCPRFVPKRHLKSIFYQLR
ncbi:MAG: protein-glutamate O-methyltransferase CheR [Desulfobacteraceae bacterium]